MVRLLGRGEVLLSQWLAHLVNKKKICLYINRFRPPNSHNIWHNISHAQRYRCLAYVFADAQLVMGAGSIA